MFKLPTSESEILGETKFLGVVWVGSAAYPRLQSYWGDQTRTHGRCDSRYPLSKTKKSAHLAHYFSEVAKFCIKNPTPNLRGQRQGFTGEIPQKISRVKILVGKVFPLSPVVDTPMGWVPMNSYSPPPQSKRHGDAAANKDDQLLPGGATALA